MTLNESKAAQLTAFIEALQQLSQNEGLCLKGKVGASVKLSQADCFGEQQEVLWMTPPAWQGEPVTGADLIPLRCSSLARLVSFESPAPDVLENELACSRLKAASPIPSTEAWLHAALPFSCLLTVRADALLALAYTQDSPACLQDCFGFRLLYLAEGKTDYERAQTILRQLDHWDTQVTQAIILPDGRLLVGGASPQETLAHLVELQSIAEAYVQSHGAWNLDLPQSNSAGVENFSKALPAVRKAVSESFGHPLILSRLEFPGNALLVERFNEKPVGEGEKAQAAPCLIADANLGWLVAGQTASEVECAKALYHQALTAMLRAEKLQGKPIEDFYGRLAQFVPDDLFPVSSTAADYSLFDRSQLFKGEVALVTGGASGIGKACVEALLARGAAVATLDINPRVEHQYDTPAYLGLTCDLTDEAAILKCFEQMARKFGGLDMLVLNAGIFPAGIRIEALDTASWSKVMRINLDSNLIILREAYPLLKEAPRYGRVLVNASKNVPAPGAGAAAYSSSKAAVTQMARVAALEWGKDKIRVNIIHPDAIFDTGIWTEDVLKTRAAHYGLTVQQYKTRNVLGVELNSHYVGELVAEMLGPLFEKITGAQVPVDGGSDRVI